MKQILLGLSIIVAGAISGTTAYIIDGAEQKLRNKGFTWSSRSIEFTQVRWSRVHGPGLTADQLKIQPSWPLRVELKEVHIDPTGFESPHNSNSSQASVPRSSSVIDIPFEVHASKLRIAWGDDPLFENLSGTLHPSISLTNTEDTIEARWDPSKPRHIQGMAKTSVTFEHARADIEATFNLRDYLDLEIASDNLRLSHSFLSTQSSPDIPMNMRVVWNPDTEELAADGQIGTLAWSVVGTSDTKTHNLQFRVPMTPLSTIVSVFGDMIPEADSATVRGEVGLAAHIAGPPWDWSFEPAAHALSVSGALPTQFGGDRIRWKRNGIAYETGPGTRDWVRLDEAGWLPEAAIAAEDIRFRAHSGFDLVAIQEALDASVHEERVRGGSTITQQLAKNLFLDGRRTLVRKLRELLLALDMEERMSKDAILALYLNVVEFGPGIHGIAEASDAWFLKDPAHLSPREAAFLVSILPAPNMWHKRISETKRVPIQRVNEVLNRMRIRGSIGPSQHQQAIRERLRVVPP